jgi:hypothetical protein
MIRDFFRAAVIVFAVLLVCADLSKRDEEITYVKD